MAGHDISSQVQAAPEALCGQFDNRGTPLAQFALPGRDLAPTAERVRVRVKLTAKKLLDRYKFSDQSAVGVHLRLPDNAGNVVYTYIRKNGCSAFKTWLLAEANRSGAPAAPFNLLSREYEVSHERDMAGARRLLVLRDPVERLCSMYRNKYVQQVYADDSINNLKALTDLGVEDVTFARFVESYLYKYISVTRAGRPVIDPHCATQYSHLWPIHYDAVIMLKDLRVMARELFGEAIQDQYFTRPTNVSSSDLADGDVSDVSARDLHQRFKDTNSLPTNDAFLTPDIREAIEAIYNVDYMLIKSAFSD